MSDYNPFKIDFDDLLSKLEPGSIEFYVIDKVKAMEDCLKLGAGKDLTFYELQEALMEHEHISLSLLILQNEARILLHREKNKFDVWKDEQYIKIKHRENTKELSGQKWASATELNSMVKAENKQEYLRLANEYEECDHKYAFMNHVIKIWDAYSYTLNTLSQNIRSEVSMQRS
jgi:hypothetical protein